MNNLIPPKLGYKPPRWMIDYDYPERGEDIASDLVSLHLWNKWKGKESELEDPYVLDRALAEAHFDAVENVSDMEQAVHQATMYVIYTISEKEWYRHAEYDDLVLFLEDKMRGYEERQEERGSRPAGGFYELKNLMNIIDYLRKLGVPKEKVLGIRHNLSKAKTASSEMRNIAASDMPESEKKDALLEVLDDVVNPDVTVRDFYSRNKDRSIEQAKAHLPMKADIYLVQGMELVLIESPDKGSTKALELSLSGLVDGWTFRDGTALLRTLTERVYTKKKFKPARIIYEERVRPLFKWGDGGYPMPVQDHMNSMIYENLGANERLVYQVLDGQDVCWLPLYNIGRGISQPELGAWIRKSFHFEPRDDKSPYVLLKEAVERTYSVPSDLGTYYHDLSWRIQLTWFNRALGIDLRIERSE